MLLDVDRQLLGPSNEQVGVHVRVAVGHADQATTGRAVQPDTAMSDLLEGVVVVFGVVLGAIVALLLSVAAYEATFGRWGCEQFAEMSGVEVQWKLSSGCLVRAKDGTVMSLSTYQKRHVQDRMQLEVK
jgi:hypothetical protein